MSVSSRFVRACNKQTTDTVPVWFMRQAGRYMPEYRSVRTRHSILEICRTPALAAEVTITAAEALGVDAAIIFADLLLPAEPLGLKLTFNTGEGPSIEPALRERRQIEQLPDTLQGELGYIAEAVRLVDRHFAGKIPVIGFSGAPFTLASYLVEGGGSRNYVHTKRWMYDDPQAWALLMEKLCRALLEYLTEQVQAGAAAIQLFDSWVGALSEADYRRFVLPFNRRLVESVQALGVPAIYFSTGTAGYLETVAETGAQVISVDWRVDLAQAWSRLHHRPALQGNLDPVALFASQKELRGMVHRLLEKAGGRSGYIFNLGHGILPETPVENVKAVTEWVHEFAHAGRI